MKDLLKMICSNDATLLQPTRIVQEICRLNDFEIDRQMEAATEEQSNAIGAYVGVWVRGKNSLSTLQCGALFSVFNAATPELSRAKQIEVMRKETGIDRTQQYRCIDAFKCFGRILIPDAKLASCFVVESLKILSMPSTPQQARDQAIALAREGETITEEVARSLRRQFSVPSEDSPSRGTSALSADPLVGLEPLHEELPVAPVKKNHSRENPGQAAVAEIEERKAAIEATKSRLETSPANESVVYQDNLLKITISPVGGRKEVSPEDTCYALEQALEQFRLKFPVQALAATTAPINSMEDDNYV